MGVKEVKMRRWFLLLGFFLPLLAACAPRLARPAAPVAELAGAELVSIDPFADRFALRLKLRIKNPNPFDLPLLKSELRVRLGDWETAGTLPALTLPAGRRVPATVPVEGGLTPAAGVARAILEGRSLPLVLTGRLQVEALGQKFWLGPVTLLRDRIHLAVRLAPPRVTLRSARLILAPGSLRLSLRYLAENPLPVGFSLSGGLAVRLAGATVGEAPLDLRLPPAGSREQELGLSIPLSAIPGAAQALLGGAPFELSGNLRVEVPGVYAGTLPFVLSGTAR